MSLKPTFSKMTPDMRKWLKTQIEVKLRRSPGCSLIDLKEWIRGDNSHDWSVVDKRTFHNFLNRNMLKFQQQGNLNSLERERQEDLEVFGLSANMYSRC